MKSYLKRLNFAKSPEKNRGFFVILKAKVIDGGQKMLLVQIFLVLAGSLAFTLGAGILDVNAMYPTEWGKKDAEEFMAEWGIDPSDLKCVANRWFAAGAMLYLISFLLQQQAPTGIL